MNTLLQVQQLSVSFGQREVVHAIDFDIGKGEKVALVGESGSGKTISALSLLGLARGAQVKGQCLFDGQDLLRMNEPHLQGIRGSQIAMIFQEPMTALNPLFTIGEQIAELLQWKESASRESAWQRAVELLNDTGIPEPRRRAHSYPHQLSGGQRQRAMIAMALACKPQLLLADEPTTALDVSVRGQILDLLDHLQQRHGMSVLLFTHDLNMVRRFAHRVVVMDKGYVVEHGNVQDVLARPQHPYTQQLVDSIAKRHVPDRKSDAPLLIDAQKIQVTYPVPIAGWRGWFRKGQFVAVQCATFQIKKAHTLGVMGESGSGKSTLALAVLGLLQFEGQLQIKEKSWMHQTQTDLPLRRAVQVVFQDPFSSLSPRMTVEQLVGEGLRPHFPDLSLSQRQDSVLQALSEVGLDETQFPGLLARYPHEFSGGQRQRLAIARALVVSPEILVLDEPTSALDVTIQRQVIDLLQQLQFSKGLSYLLITHDVDVIRAMSHDVCVMKDGQVVESGDVDAVLGNPQQAYTRLLVSASSHNLA